MNFFFLLLLVVFWGFAAYSLYQAQREREYNPSHLSLSDAADGSNDLGDLVIGFVMSVLGATFGALLKLIFGRWGSRAIYMGQAAICYVLGGIMLWLGILFA